MDGIRSLLSSFSPNTSDTELLRYLTAHKNDDYIEDLEVKGEQ